MAGGRSPVPAGQRARAAALRGFLKAKRDERQMGPEELARAAGVNRRTLDNYFLKESRSPSFFLIAAIARVLQLNLDDLASLSESDAT